MTRRPRLTGADPFADLAKKIAILEQEMATQKVALERLKAMSSMPPARRAPAPQTRRTA